MAITIDDFSKIWASTSPLTPYAFSDSHYQEGWNFIGSTPPSRQMWDFLQKNNDEKMQYLANNYLPLSGGTLTGVLKTGYYISQSADDGRLSLNGGSNNDSGAYLNLYGKNHATEVGSFSLTAYDGITRCGLYGKNDGTLKWKNYNVLTAETVGAVVSQTFTNTTTLSANTATDLGSISLSAGTWVVTGHIRYDSIIVGRQFIVINDVVDLNAGTESCVVHYSNTAAPGATLSLSTTRIFVLSATTTIYLVGYASASCDAGADNHLTAVRIV